MRRGQNHPLFLGFVLGQPLRGDLDVYVGVRVPGAALLDTVAPAPEILADPDRSNDVAIAQLLSQRASEQLIDGGPARLKLPSVIERAYSLP
jgi:hypothetical protein